MKTGFYRALGIACAGVAVGGFLLLRRSAVSAAPSAPPHEGLAAAIEALQAEVERLKKVVPDQAHAMQDVDYHFTHLWFAGKANNWPLADFYWKETLSHLHWAVRIIPVRKDNAGNDVRLEEILESIEKSPFMQMGEVIKQQDQQQFDATYRRTLEGCYSCHKASDKPFLKPKMPDQVPCSIINFDPSADWPN